jgi:hypothetical protein
MIVRYGGLENEAQRKTLTSWRLLEMQNRVTGQANNAWTSDFFFPFCISRRHLVTSMATGLITERGVAFRAQLPQIVPRLQPPSHLRCRATTDVQLHSSGRGPTGYRLRLRLRRSARTAPTRRDSLWLSETAAPGPRPHGRPRRRGVVSPPLARFPSGFRLAVSASRTRVRV